jgi:hypothetical protein
LSETNNPPWRVLIDANTQYRVGEVFRLHGADVVHVTDVFQDGTDDESIDQWARASGRIIVGHDRRFLQAIQRRMYQFDIPVNSGYGRIMLCGKESRQPERMTQVLPFLRLCYNWALIADQRFLVAIADNFIRYDDRLLERTPRQQRTDPPNER